MAQLIHLSTVIIFILFAFCFTSPVQSEEMTLQKQGEQLFERYKNKLKRIEQLSAQSKSLSGMSLESMQYRILQRHLNAFQTIDTLVDNIEQQNQAGINNLAFVNQVKPYLMPIGMAIQHYIDKENKNYNKQTLEIDENTITGFELFIQHTYRIDGALASLAQHLKNLALLALDDPASSHFLKQALIERAELFAGRIEFTQTQLEEIARILAIKPKDEGLLDRQAFSLESLNITKQSLETMVTLLAEIKVNTDYYRQILLSSTSGEISSELLNLGFVGELLSGWIDDISFYLTENASEIIFKLFVVIGIIYLFSKLSKLVEKLITRSLNNSKLNVSNLMKEMIISLLSRFIMIIGIIIALAQIGVSLAPILAGLGVAGFIIGFALQDTLGNFAAGLMILIYRPYDVKDVVDVAGGVHGEVKSMSLVSTTVLTFDNQTLVIPNSKIWGDVIKNVTAQRVRRVDLVFGIGYSDNIEQAERVLKEIVEAHEKVLKKPEHNIKLHVLNSSSVDFIVRPWVRTDDYWDVYWDITREVKIRFDQEGISIPFPQQDVHLYRAND